MVDEYDTNAFRLKLFNPSEYILCEFALMDRISHQCCEVVKNQKAALMFKTCLCNLSRKEWSMSVKLAQNCGSLGANLERLKKRFPSSP